MAQPDRSFPPGGRVINGYDIAPDISDYWPRRLLHIPTMTSHERAEGDWYGETQRPDYSILSYTWGRWEDRNPHYPRSLPVLGVPWKVPTIKESHFTVETFQKIVNQMQTTGLEWAWIDIACIDQESDAIKMDEVGRQASIFRKASNVFVWLSHSCCETMATAMDVLDSKAPGIWSTDDIDKLDFGLVREIDEAVTVIFSDPWFSSLWTLQEIVLRNDALILTATGDSITLQSGYPLYMLMLINSCMNIYKKLNMFLGDFKSSEYSSRKANSITDTISHTLQLIAQAGFYYTFATNPNVQYGTAKYRTTSRPEDRIYAIMQIYNLRVGQSLRPNDQPSVDSLKHEFALAINSYSLLLGQLFLHTSRPVPGLSWCITEMSRVPQTLLSCRRPETFSSMTYSDSKSIQVVGPLCSFADWIQAQRYFHESLNLEPPELFLDDHIVQEVDLSERMFWDMMNRKPGENWMGYVEFFAVAHDRSKLYILHLGCVQGPVVVPSYGTARHSYYKQHFGLLLKEADSPEPQNSEPLYERLGIFTWSIWPHDFEHPDPKSAKIVSLRHKTLEELFSHRQTLTLI